MMNTECCNGTFRRNLILVTLFVVAEVSVKYVGHQKAKVKVLALE
ncbi:hypothetical protein [Endozoicomonas sp. ALD068]